MLADNNIDADANANDDADATHANVDAHLVLMLILLMLMLTLVLMLQLGALFKGKAGTFDHSTLARKGGALSPNRNKTEVENYFITNVSGD